MTRGKATLAILAALCTSIALADDFKTVDGKEYKNAKVSRVEPDGLVINFPGGIVKIPFTELSPEIQQKYGYNPGTAAEFQKQAYEAGLARAREISEASQQQAEERARYWKEHSTPRPHQESSATENLLSQIRIFAIITPSRFGKQQTVARIQPVEQYDTERKHNENLTSLNYVPVYDWRKVGDEFTGVIDEPMSERYQSGNTAVVTLYKIGHTHDSSRHPLFTSDREKAVNFLAAGSTQ